MNPIVVVFHILIIRIEFSAGTADVSGTKHVFGKIDVLLSIHDTLRVKCEVSIVQFLHHVVAQLEVSMSHERVSSELLSGVACLLTMLGRHALTTLVWAGAMLFNYTRSAMAAGQCVGCRPLKKACVKPKNYSLGE